MARRTSPTVTIGGAFNPTPEPIPAKMKKFQWGTQYEWSELVAADSRLQDLMDEVLSVAGEDWKSCPNNHWYGYADSRKGLKRRLRKYTGSETRAFYAAYDHLYGAYRPCAHCRAASGYEPEAPAPSKRQVKVAQQRAVVPDARQSLLEKDIENRLVAMYRLKGKTVEQQVRTAAGIIDVLTETAIFEIKLRLDRTSIVHAVGQLTLYAAVIDGNRRKIIVGQETPSTASMVSALNQAGIEIGYWDSADGRFRK